jgi:hypothetical protein
VAPTSPTKHFRESAFEPTLEVAVVDGHRSFLRKLAYSALASLYMGNSGSAFFQSVRNSSFE